ncbi:MAG: enoyl-CoA hydratase/isomerase family protein [Burkholderiales bacterium]
MLRIDTRGAFVFATLDAPATRNALSDAMVVGLGDALALAESQPALRALVIRGAGSTFCAGGDFSGFRALMAEPVPAGGVDPIVGFNRGFGALLERIHASPVATIAVVEGAAIGGGCGLSATCDFVLAAGNAQFAMPEVTLGLPPAQVGPFVAARLGHGAALRLLLTGRRITAAQALACGLADEVHEAAELDERLTALLIELGRAEPAALRATKAILQRRATEPMGTTLDFAAHAFAAALRSGTAAEGLAAMSAKRPPAWLVRPNESAE